jgi:hypothetical protein
MQKLWGRNDSSSWTLSKVIHPKNLAGRYSGECGVINAGTRKLIIDNDLRVVK